MSCVNIPLSNASILHHFPNSQSEGSGSAKGKLPLAKRQEALQAQAFAPLKQVAMLCFMMWMSGSTLHLFSIMTTLSGIYQPLTGALGLGLVGLAMPGSIEGLSRTGNKGSFYQHGWKWSSSAAGQYQRRRTTACACRAD